MAFRRLNLRPNVGATSTVKLPPHVGPRLSLPLLPWLTAIGFATSVLMLIFSSGCATPALVDHVTYFGEVDLKRAEATVEKAQAHGWNEDLPVKVYQGSFPEGLELVDAGAQLKVSEKFKNQYEVIGTVTSRTDSGFYEDLRGAFWNRPLHVKHSEGRRDYCSAQSVLRLVTLGLWTFVPFNYPCVYNFPSSEQERMELHLFELKRMAYEMGAQIVIIRSIEDGQLAEIDRSSQRIVTGPHARIPLTTVSGFAVRIKNQFAQVK